MDTIAVTRLTAGGAVDASYGIGGTAQIALAGHLVDPGLGGLRIDGAGRAVLAATGSTGTGTAFNVLRLTANGVLDGSFGTSGIAVVAERQPRRNSPRLGLGLGDSILLSGGYPDTFVAHVTAAGVPDTEFNGTGSLTARIGTQASTLTGMVRQPDGKLVLTGFGEAGFSLRSATSSWRASR